MIMSLLIDQIINICTSILNITIGLVELVPLAIIYASLIIITAMTLFVAYKILSTLNELKRNNQKIKAILKDQKTQSMRNDQKTQSMLKKLIIIHKSNEILMDSQFTYMPYEKAQYDLDCDEIIFQELSSLGNKNEITED